MGMKMIKSAIILLFISVIVVGISGCSNTSHKLFSEDPSIIKSPSPVYLQIEYAGKWEGSVGDQRSSHFISGTGNGQSMPLISNGYFSANIQKQDQGSGILTIRFVKDGIALASNSTNAKNSAVSLSGAI